MLFHSHEYIYVFLPLVVVLFYFLRSQRGARNLLLAASLCFYGWWNPIYLPILISSIVANYTIGRHLERSASRGLLALGVVLNVGVLFYFKYYNFFLENIPGAYSEGFALHSLALPLGISFFSFQQITYLVDAYHKKSYKQSLLDYGLFVSFFPQLIAGPIVYHKELSPQIAALKKRAASLDNISKGLFLISIGLFKVLVIAHGLSLISDAVYADSHNMSLAEAWVGAAAFYLQIYFDFSAYTDLALGSALMLGITLPQNFNSPYHARTIANFWQRWHITLGRFFRDYCFIPLNQHYRFVYSRHIILIFTFIIIGLWHGADWTFFLFGLMHGMAMFIFRLHQKTGIKLPAVAAWFITSLVVLLSAVLFRADNVSDALGIYSSLFLLNDLPALRFALDIPSTINGTSVFSALYMLPVAAVVCAWRVNSSQLTQRFVPNGAYLLFTLLLLGASIWQMSNASAFIYFEF